MELLAETLRSVRAEAFDAMRREDSIAARLVRARLIADELILELPTFLQGVSAELGCNAYICQLCCGSGYIPHAGFTKDEMPESMRDSEGKTISTTAHCYKYLFGIPRFLALWAIKEGLQARVGFWKGPDSAIFGNKRDSSGKWSTSGSYLGQGLILSW